MVEPTGAELWRSVEHTVRHVLLPAIGDDDFARAAAIQLVGLTRLARLEAADEPVAEVADALASLAGNPIADAHGGGEPMAAAGQILAAAVGDDSPAADEVRAKLRQVLIARLEADVQRTSMLVPFFRGMLDG